MSRERSTAASTMLIRAARSASPHKTTTATTEQLQVLKTEQEPDTGATRGADSGGSSDADRHREKPSIPLSRSGSRAAVEDAGKDQATTTPNAKHLQCEPKHENCSRSSGQRVKAGQSVRAHSGSTEEYSVSAWEGKVDLEAGASLAAHDLGRPSTKDPGERGQQSEVCVPEKILQLMDDRDKAVELCLQYRWKLKNVEAKLKTTERRASSLKQQLDEASASGDKEKKMFAQMIEGARVELGQKLRIAEARARNDNRNVAADNEEAHKARLQLVRARKDLRDLWLERDELATLAAGAMQGETVLQKRTKKLEALVAELRGQLDVATTSEDEKSKELACAEARAESVSAAERELRAAVVALKADFKGLVDEIRQRDLKIRALEGAKSHLVTSLVKARRSSNASGFPSEGQPQYTSRYRVQLPRTEQEMWRSSGTTSESRMKKFQATFVAADMKTDLNHNTNRSIFIGPDVYLSSCSSEEMEVACSRNSDLQRLPSRNKPPREDRGKRMTGSAVASAVAQERKRTVQENGYVDNDVVKHDRATGYAERTTQTAAAVKAPQGNQAGSSTLPSSPAKADTSAVVDNKEIRGLLPTRKKLSPEAAADDTRTRRSSISYPLRGNRVTVSPAVAAAAPAEDKRLQGTARGGSNTSPTKSDLREDPTGRILADRTLETRHLPGAVVSEESGDVHKNAEDDDRCKVMPGKSSTGRPLGLDRDPIAGSPERGSGGSRSCPQPPLPRRPRRVTSGADGKPSPLSIPPRGTTGWGNLSPSSEATCFGVSTLTPLRVPAGTGDKVATCVATNLGRTVGDGVNRQVPEHVIGEEDSVNQHGRESISPRFPNDPGAEPDSVGKKQEESGRGDGVLSNGTWTHSATTGTSSTTTAENQGATVRDFGHEGTGLPPKISVLPAKTASGASETRLLSGVPVLKHSSGWVEAKAKVLWVSPDLSEVFYTSKGRTSNPKPTARMPLAELSATKGTDHCRLLQHARVHHRDRCFALTRKADLSLGNEERNVSGHNIDGKEESLVEPKKSGPATITSQEASGIDDMMPRQDEDKDKTGPETLGMLGTMIPCEVERKRSSSGGGTLPKDWIHGRRWSWNKTKDNERWRGGLGGTPFMPSPSKRGSGEGGSRRGSDNQRESLGFEAASAEERDALVDEINELARRAESMQYAGGIDSGGGGGGGEHVQSCGPCLDGTATLSLGIRVKRCSASSMYETASGMQPRGEGGGGQYADE